MDAIKTKKDDQIDLTTKHLGYNQLYRFEDGLELRNAFALAPLDLRLALYDGTVSQNDIAFHQIHARQVGLDIVGSAYVQENGRTRAGALSVATDEMIPGLRQLATTIHRQGAKAILQLSHAGIRARPTFGKQLVGPSERYQVQAMDVEQIVALAQSFGEATRRAVQAGFDGVELQGANRFLLQQFVSPITNQRIDDFGGSLENRLRVPLLIARTVLQIAKRCPRPFLVGYRVSPEELSKRGMTVTDTLVLARLLEKMEVDYLSLSLHRYDQVAQTYDGKTPVSQLFTQQLKNLPVMVAGKIETSDDLEKLAQGVSLIATGRATIVNPSWPIQQKKLTSSEIEQGLDAQKLIISSQVRQAITDGLGR
ncbi:MAG TPA: NADH:flavin oxidoreductase [Candidatus Levilactobacillus faecigallinarum]|uniref:NADH:flavin oxidoreductase n=1 Tax=Candidatus Levilactobacillus faecigallinarum TaxID=2838638 RepID=A0A9D1QRS9_9LACO|nr:NADH:flavin oxidoreductase [Candidatus Levilactobacillus faecigallinarum]